MKKAFTHFIRHILYPFLDDVLLPFLGFSALGIAAVFAVAFIARLMVVTAVFAWNLI